MSIKQTKIWRFFSSPKLAIWLLSIIATLSLVGTFIPQNEDPSFYIERFGSAGFNFLSKAGLNNIYSVWWFILFLILLALNLLICLLNRVSFKLRMLGTLLAHFSILVILSGALVGLFFGEKGYIQIKEGETINRFLSKNKLLTLSFSLRLDDFLYEEYIDPKEKLLVYAKDNKLLGEISLSKGGDLKLTGGESVRILRFIPDFSIDITTKQVVSRSSEPKNPAIEVEFSLSAGKAGAAGRKDTKIFWVFAHFPDIHDALGKDYKFVYQWVMRRPKDFISKVTILKDAKEMMRYDIRVNHPLRFEGYSFFQSSYDKENLSWSGLQVNKDPGVPIVYAGFILLILGLTMIFYINPLLIKKR